MTREEYDTEYLSLLDQRAEATEAAWDKMFEGLDKLPPGRFFNEHPDSPEYAEYLRLVAERDVEVNAAQAAFEVAFNVLVDKYYPRVSE